MYLEALRIRFTHQECWFLARAVNTFQNEVITDDEQYMPTFVCDERKVHLLGVPFAIGVLTKAITSDKASEHARDVFAATLDKIKNAVQLARQKQQ